MRGPSCFDIERRQGLRILLFILTSAFNSFARSSPQAGLLLSDQTPVDVGSAEVHTERGEFRPARCAENYRGPQKASHEKTLAGPHSRARRGFSGRYKPYRTVM
jgi:hypothetical protein